MRKCENFIVHWIHLEHRLTWFLIKLKLLYNEKDINFYRSIDIFLKSKKDQRIILMTTKAPVSYTKFKFQKLCYFFCLMNGPQEICICLYMPIYLNIPCTSPIHPYTSHKHSIYKLSLTRRCGQKVSFGPEKLYYPWNQAKNKQWEFGL